MRPYRVDGEVGRFEFPTHRCTDQSGEEYNTCRDFFPELKVKEFYKTTGFKEISMIYGDTKDSYRRTSKLINRMRYQETGGTPHRTLQENTAKEGTKVFNFIHEKSKRILKANGFTEEGAYLGNNPEYSKSEPVTLSDETIKKASEECIEEQEIRIDALENPVCYEHPENTLNICIDDVNVKRQESTRQQREDVEKRKRKYVHNTVAYLSEGDCSYTLNGYGTKLVLCLLIAFIVKNGLTGKRFQFFTDGHKILNATILKCFKWYKNIGIILDWYHLEKKCKEQLSMALKGREIRNKVLEDLLPLLWNGLTDKAIAFLEKMDVSKIKDQSVLQKLVEYLRRNKNYIPCYAIRKKVGLRNSSNIGEKMNDLIVSDRQKHNGMSWSKKGSVALASVTALERNDEWKNWFENGEIEFKLASNQS